MGHLADMVQPAGPWIWISKNVRIRRMSDGEWLGQRTGSTKRLLGHNRELRRTDHWKKGSEEFRSEARWSHGYEAEMLLNCGTDPGLRALYLRDHPELLTVKRKRADLPNRKMTIYPKKEEGPDE